MVQKSEHYPSKYVDFSGMIGLTHLDFVGACKDQ